MKQRTGNVLFSEVANEMAELHPLIDKKQLSISFKGDFWINQHFLKQQHTEEGIVALASNLDFIPPDLKDEAMRRSLHQKTTGCNVDSLFIRAQAHAEGRKIERMEISRTEPWEGSALKRVFDEFYMPALRNMLTARFCIDLLIGEEVNIANYYVKIRYTDGSRLISSIVGAYYLAQMYQCLDTFHSDIMEAAKESLQHDFERTVLNRILELEDAPDEFVQLMKG
jgi:hypothetical protein